MASMRARSKIEVRTATQSCATRTAMPFLYQTRTLLPVRQLQMPGSQFFHIPSKFRSPKISSNRTSFTSSATCRSYTPSNSRKDLKMPVGRNGNWISQKNSPETMEVSKQNGVLTSENQENQSKEFEDFGYMIPSDDLHPFQGKDMSSDDEEGSNKTMKAAAPQQKESTITISERLAFERIFADIMARSRSVSAGEASNFSPSTLSPSNHQDDILIKKSFKKTYAKGSLLSVMDEALKEDGRRRTLPLGGRLATKTTEELQADVDRYPIPLRAAAARALGLASVRAVEPLKDEIVSDADEMEIIRQPERERVEKLMHDAQTDIELWDVLESEVFALVMKLGLVKMPEVRSENTNHRERRRKKSLEVAKSGVSSSVGGDQLLDLKIHGPLYPSYALLGLRLLDRAFTKSSPLVLNILPRIKSLGIVSHVLGASTAFYNELLRIYWTRYDNFLGVSKLLYEMEQAGLEFDEQTLKIVDEINEAQLKVRRGDRGKVLQALWSLPEFAPGRFRAWRKKIEASVGEGGKGNADRAEWHS